MARYTNLKCGKCGYSFTGGYAVGNPSKLGASKVKCPKCSCINNTYSKPYSKFTFFDHMIFWSGRIFRMLVLGFLYGSLIGYGIYSLLDTNSEEFIVGGAIVGIIGNVVYNYFNIKYQIREVEKEEVGFETPEKKTESTKNVIIKNYSKVDELASKLLKTFPEFDASEKYDAFENTEDFLKLEKMKREYLSNFEILTWPTTRISTDDNNKIYSEHIALYIKKSDRQRFIEDKINFSGPVYIQEDLVFDEDGELLLWGYFEHPKTKLLLQQAKDSMILGKKKVSHDNPYFVIR